MWCGFESRFSQDKFERRKKKEQNIVLKKKVRGMELVCGMIGLNAEHIKGLRVKCKEIGFSCRSSGGRIYLKESGEARSWEKLLRLVGNEQGLLPIYFRLGERIVGLEYGKECIVKEERNRFGMRLLGNSLIGVRNVLISMRIGSIKKIVLKSKWQE